LVTERLKKMLFVADKSYKKILKIIPNCPLPRGILLTSLSIRKNSSGNENLMMISSLPLITNKPINK